MTMLSDDDLGCRWNNETTIAEGQTVTPDPEKEPCTQCQCTQGSMVCTRRTCPVLPCPANKALLQPGACCPVCQGKTHLCCFSLFFFILFLTDTFNQKECGRRRPIAAGAKSARRVSQSAPLSGRTRAPIAAASRILRRSASATTTDTPRVPTSIRRR